MSSFDAALVDFGFCPGERFRIFVVGFDAGIDMLLELLDRSERCAGQRLALQDGLDLIKSRRACRRKVECYKRVAFQPFVVLLVCVQRRKSWIPSERTAFLDRLAAVAEAA